MIFNEFTKVFLIGADEGKDESTRATRLLLIMGISPDNIFGGYCHDVLLASEKKNRLHQLIQCDVAVNYSENGAFRGMASKEKEAANIFGVPVIDMAELEHKLADCIIERYDKIINANIPLETEYITGLSRICLVCPFFNECDNNSFHLACRLSRATAELAAEKEEDQNESGDYENRD